MVVNKESGATSEITTDHVAELLDVTTLLGCIVYTSLQSVHYLRVLCHPTSTL